LKRKIFAAITFILFECLVIFAFYLYSLHSDFLPWGNSHRDGLDMLFFFFVGLPGMMLLSLIKMIIWKSNDFIRYSYWLYTVMISLLAFICAGKYSRPLLSTLIAVSVIVAICNVIEFYFWLDKLQPSKQD
jgi:hypothetical protein